MSDRLVTIAVSVLLQDAGEATRSLELMKAVRAISPSGYTMRGIFFSHGSKFDPIIEENGFELYPVEPKMEGRGFLSDLKPTTTNFIGDTQLAAELLRGEIGALQACRPDFILHGFWPIAGLARRMVSPAIPGISFLPLPLASSTYAFLMKDTPDQIKPLTHLPVKTRRKIMAAIPKSLILKLPILRQKNLLRAARQCGWSGTPLKNLFDLLRADFTVVNDLAEFYGDVSIPSNYAITGPIYAQSVTIQKHLDPRIESVFQKSSERQINIFCSMGSSAKKELLMEAAKAIASLPENQFHAVILAPSAICPLDEILAVVKDHKNIYVTDQFVPAACVNAMADITLCHGGQGTLQTAMVSESPVIGVAMQPEQQINLDHIVSKGAGIRIPITRWNKKNVLAAMESLVSDSSYQKSAAQLGQTMKQADGGPCAAQAIWRFIEANPAKD
ncbi:nucleotide disphospho-sugar-binding domain-containing protein [Faecalispora jeddahensis]|uniref:nucleotide disphospho-sugar-binding domain-containing protein n=1 Tax=Faecalispora jeddahensis TaxID=1414721 RepID=UPI00145C13F7|nr:nucleotide disphospho-sugar-binding domain-containing protein [Faecalispora jeddahensis]